MQETAVYSIKYFINVFFYFLLLIQQNDLTTTKHHILTVGDHNQKYKKTNTNELNST